MEKKGLKVCHSVWVVAVILVLMVIMPFGATPAAAKVIELKFPSKLVVFLLPHMSSAFGFPKNNQQLRQDN